MINEEKYQKFLTLHHQDHAFLMPNPWDVGTARILESLGFQALATTSAGYAYTQGKRDSACAITRQEMLNHAQQIVEATSLPVSADLENGFGDTPKDCAETVALACSIGLVGGSIEDATMNAAQPIYPLDLATERIRAAAEAVKDKPFVLTARAENYLWGKIDLADTICRLQVYAEAGAEVLYAPNLPDLDAIATVCREIDKPVNVVMGSKRATYTVAKLSAVGVKRISVGGSLARTAMGAFIRAVTEIYDDGTFTYAKDTPSDDTITSFFDS